MFLAQRLGVAVELLAELFVLSALLQKLLEAFTLFISEVIISHSHVVVVDSRARALVDHFVLFDLEARHVIIEPFFELIVVLSRRPNASPLLKRLLLFLFSAAFGALLLTRRHLILN